MTETPRDAAIAAFGLCEVHTPDLWEIDDGCVICEAIHQHDELRKAEQEIATLRAALEQAKGELSDHQQIMEVQQLVLRQFEERDRALRAERDRLQEALRTHGRHAPDCYGEYDERRCNCDLSAMLVADPPPADPARTEVQSNLVPQALSWLGELIDTLKKDGASQSHIERAELIWFHLRGPQEKK
jgi:DNA repair exonuclease SbcCD ATPase subunit